MVEEELPRGSGWRNWRGDTGDLEAARAAAERALALAQCDGGEYVYERGQRSAREVLAALG